MKRTLLAFLGLLLAVVPKAVQAQTYTNSDNFTYQINNGTVTITGYTGSLGTIEIPGTINVGSTDLPENLPVTTIGDNAFQYYNLTNVTIPGSVTSIDNWAFAYCYSLIGVYFKGNAPYESGPNIGYQTFVGDTNATAYYIPHTTGWGLFSVAEIPIAPWIPDSLQVTIIPESAIAAGAKWRVDDGTWQNSGAVANLSVASHTVSFKAISGWTTPAAQTLFVGSNLVVLANGTYLPATGSLQVTITPSLAVADSAQWCCSGQLA
jgi:hypothetical protein